ncbi:MAG: YlxR family protein [Patescibacteria group bacterium]|nr:YlxR family protein [Patescibacteria group bacterium]
MLTKKISKKKKHVPIRTCIACRCKKPKKEMIRWVLKGGREPVIDLEGKGTGRGANLCSSLACFDKAVKLQAFNRVWKTRLDLGDVQEKRKQMEKAINDNQKTIN